MDFLLNAAPYILIFFGVILTFIIVMKVAIYRREKSLSNKPQDMSRFDLPVETKEGSDNDSS